MRELSRDERDIERESVSGISGNRYPRLIEERRGERES